MRVKYGTPLDRSVAVAYSALATGALYGASLAGSPGSSDLWTLVGVVLLGCVAGAVVGRWWTVLLPIVPAALAFPLELFASPAAAATELPMFGIPIAAVGVGARRAFEESKRDLHRVSWRGVALVLAYAAGAGALMVYVSSVDGDEELATSIIVGFFVAHAMVGVALGRWRALLLILLLPILAIPVPVPEDAYEPLPLWYAMLIFVGPLAAVVMAVGVGVRKAWSRAAGMTR